MKTPHRKGTARAVLTVALHAGWSFGLLAGFAARADGPSERAAPDPTYVQECGACHTAFPPGMLPAASWQRLMGDLQRHYGSDASIDPAAQARLSAWLASNAGTYRRVSEPPPEDRLTRSAWFVRKHRELQPEVWKRKAVGSPARCEACHGDAAKWNFDEHAVRIPK